MTAFVKRHWFVGVLLGSLLLHGVGLYALQPWAQSRMAFDAAAHAERARQVRQREMQRRAIEKQQREQQMLSEQQVEQLIERQREQKQRELREHVQRLKRAREELMKQRDQAFERIRQRKLEEVLAKRAESLLPRIEHLTQQLDDEIRHTSSADRKDDAEQSREDRKALQRMREAVQSAIKAPDDGQAIRELSDEIAQQAEAMRERYDQRRWNREDAPWVAAGVAEAAKQLEQTAKSLNDVNAAELNDTSAAEEIPAIPEAAQPAEQAEASAAELWEAATALEQQIRKAHAQQQAAERALAEGASLAEKLDGANTAMPDRPDLAEALAAAHDAGNQPPGSQGEQPGASGQAGAQAGMTVGELNAYREALEKAAEESREMAASSEAMAGLQSPRSGANRAGAGAMHAGQSAHGRRNLTLNMGATSGAGTGSRFNDRFRGEDASVQNRPGRSPSGRIDLNKQEVFANALPGRKLTADSVRQGFVYIDTWYVIGPWANHGRTDYRPIHPPEQGVNLDAVYANGKFADQPEHPAHLLRWQFVQSDRPAIQPPYVSGDSTYYAYTEVYSDRTREILLAVASDDQAKAWLNGDVVWEEIGLSSWRVDEGMRRVVFQRGFNTILVRIENYPAKCAFSMVFTPSENAAGP